MTRRTETAPDTETRERTVTVETTEQVERDVTYLECDVCERSVLEDAENPAVTMYTISRRNHRDADLVGGADTPLDEVTRFDGDILHFSDLRWLHERLSFYREQTSDRNRAIGFGDTARATEPDTTTFDAMAFTEGIDALTRATTSDVSDVHVQVDLNDQVSAPVLNPRKHICEFCWDRVFGENE